MASRLGHWGVSMWNRSLLPIRKCFWSYSCLLLGPLTGISQTALSQDPEPDPGPSFHRGPYVQWLQSRSIYVVWQSDIESIGRVELQPNSPEARTIVSSTPARQHEVLIDGLAPDSSVDYRVVISAPDDDT